MVNFTVMVFFLFPAVGIKLLFVLICAVHVCAVHSCVYFFQGWSAGQTFIVKFLSVEAKNKNHHSLLAESYACRLSYA